MQTKQRPEIKLCRTCHRALLYGWSDSFLPSSRRLCIITHRFLKKPKYTHSKKEPRMNTNRTTDEIVVSAEPSTPEEQTTIRFVDVHIYDYDPEQEEAASEESQPEQEPGRNDESDQEPNGAKTTTPEAKGYHSSLCGHDHVHLGYQCSSHGVRASSAHARCNHYHCPKHPTGPHNGNASRHNGNQRQGHSFKAKHSPRSP